MPILRKIAGDFKRKGTLKGVRIASCLHIEAKTACLVIAFKEAGAEVSLAGSNPLSTQDDVVRELVKSGVKTFARRGETEEEYRDFILRALQIKPHILVDDGADLVDAALREGKTYADSVIGGSEETTTGVMREKAFEKEGLLKFPIIAVNSGRCKYLFDNKHGTGQSAWDGIIRTTNLSIAGKSVVVAGYGWVGRGIAQKGRCLDAKVIVTETDPIRALEAHMDGFQVMPMAEASRIGDIFITSTSNIDVIGKEHMKEMKDGAILANAGHFNVEISMQQLNKIARSKREVRDNITEYTLESGKRLFVLGKGRLVNLACADGHPVEIMDLSFSLQMLSVKYLLENSNILERKVYDLPESIDREIAELALAAYGIRIDSLTKKQMKYLNKSNS